MGRYVEWIDRYVPVCPNCKGLSMVAEPTYAKKWRFRKRVGIRTYDGFHCRDCGWQVAIADVLWVEAGKLNYDLELEERASVREAWSDGYRTAKKLADMA